MGNLCNSSRNSSTNLSSLDQDSSLASATDDHEHGHGAINAPSTSASAAVAAAADLPPITRDDIMVMNQQDKVIVREPGRIRGNEFVIDSCQNCDIYVMDRTAQITVDSCINCRFFFGPSESSVFIRDCTDCKAVIACQQLRLRDCQKFDFMLYCGTQPVIESSSQLRFGCFQYSYFNLREQFQQSNLSVWTNEWCYIHDFTPSGSQHWDFLDENLTAHDLIRPVSEFSATFSLEEEKMDSVVPLTAGSRPVPKHETCFVLVCSGHHEVAFSLLSQFSAQLKSRELILKRSRECKLSKDQLSRLLARDPNADALLVAALKGPVVGLEFSGPRCNDILGEALSAHKAHVLVSNAASAAPLANQFFTEFKPVAV